MYVVRHLSFWVNQERDLTGVRVRKIGTRYRLRSETFFSPFRQRKFLYTRKRSTGDATHLCSSPGFSQLLLVGLPPAKGHDIPEHAFRLRHRQHRVLEAAGPDCLEIVLRVVCSVAAPPL